MNLLDLESSLESTQSSIISLGAINLAAPDEIEEESKNLLKREPLKHTIQHDWGVDVTPA